MDSIIDGHFSFFEIKTPGFHRGFFENEKHQILLC